MTKRTKAKPKTKAPKVERWSTTAILHPEPGGDFSAEMMGGAMVHVRAEAAKTPGARAVLLVEANPRADAVLAAARKWVRSEPGSDPFGDAENALVRAVEALERGG